jgi:hypothetical protein
MKVGLIVGGGSGRHHHPVGLSAAGLGTPVRGLGGPGHLGRPGAAQPSADRPEGGGGGGRPVGHRGVAAVARRGGLHGLFPVRRRDGSPADRHGTGGRE